ncbi:MAG: Fic family protein [Fidelibacterota bacterium]|nr:MAG: Fic family protein [Candidatus Neomarinimicrobiota bacterium]
MTIEDTTETRSGRFILQSEGYKVFIPWGLPPDPPIEPDSELWLLLSDADRSLGRLDGSAETLANPDLFVPMYVRKEAIFSSQIEGSEISLIDLLKFEAGDRKLGSSWEVKHVLGCQYAINHGLHLLDNSSVSLDLVLACHEQLFSAGLKTKESRPGEWRQTQNFVGAPGSTVHTARFVPPPVSELRPLLENLNDYFSAESTIPPLIRAGLVHAQFETIHPFEDGNGPIGRLLITLLLKQLGIIRRPLLALSCYLQRHRKEYYDRLQAVRDHGDWENWLKFFLRGIARVAQDSIETAIKIVHLREKHWRTIAVQMASDAGNALTFLEKLYQYPIVSISQVTKILKSNNSAAQKLIGKFQKIGLLHEITGQVRDTKFAYEPYLALLEDLPPCVQDEEVLSTSEGGGTPPSQITT